jgi:uncharacterized phage protein (TIGR02218 family)
VAANPNPMIAATYASQPIFLITLAPDWSRRVSAEFSKITARVTGRTAREDREELGTELRASLRYQTLITPAEATTARGVLSSWDNRPVLCPFWPAMTLAADYASSSVQGSLRVWFEPDWSDYSINTGIAPTHSSPSVNCRQAPLMWCKFAGFPGRTIVSGDDYEVIEIAVVENGAAAVALAPKTVTLSNGASVNGNTVPLLTVPFTWGGNQSTIEVQQESTRVGYGREAADTVYAQAPRTKSTLTFTAMTGSEIAYLLYLFHTSGASVSPFWCPAPHSLSIDQRTFGRFYSDVITIEWLKPYLGGTELAEAQVEHLSLPTEQTVPSGETFGTTIGPHEKRWFGYLVTCGSRRWRFTSHESDIIGPGGNTFTAQKIEHGEITEEINLQVNDCSLSVFAWADCPFALLAQRLNAEPMTVTIYEGFIATATAATAIYTGTAMAPQINGLSMKIKLRGPGAMLKIHGPRPTMQETCAAVFGDSRCKKLLLPLTIDLFIADVTNGIATTDTTETTIAAGYFRNGYAERTVDGVKQRTPIADSYDDGGFLKLLLGSPITPALAVLGETWSCVPGCDGYYTTCVSVWGNGANFRGFPRLPRVNPAMVPVKQDSNNLGKKG